MSDDQEVIRVLREAIGVTLSVNIQELGFMPSNCAETVRQVLGSEDVVAYPALGCYLDDARKDGNWLKFKEGMRAIEASMRKNGTWDEQAERERANEQR